MTHLNDTIKVIKRIKELRELAPRNWVKIVAYKMKKSESSIRGYANGTKAPTSDYPLQVLECLNQIIEERKQKIEKLTA